MEEKVIDKSTVALVGIDGRPLKEKFEISEPLEIDQEYIITMRVQCWKADMSSNNDGTVNVLFKVTPDCLEIKKV